MRFFVLLPVMACVLSGFVGGQAAKAEARSVDFKSFLENPPPIRDMAATFSRLDGTNAIVERYTYVRWQDGAFAGLVSSRNELVLQGMAHEKDGLSTGSGHFEDYYWYINGSSRHVAAFEWEGDLPNAPEGIRRNVERLYKPIDELLTFGCHLANAGSFRWNGNNAQLTVDGRRIDAQLVVDEDGRAEHMIYVIHNPNEQGTQAASEVKWKFEYEYGNTNVPAGLPSKVIRYLSIDGGPLNPINKININRLILANERLTRTDFDPHAFVSPDAHLVPARLVNGEERILLRHQWLTKEKTASNPTSRWVGRSIYMVFAVVILSAIAFLLLSANRKQTK